MHARYLLFFGVLFVGGALPRAGAAMTTLNLNDVFSGTAPGGSSPWLTLSIQDLAPNSVQFTFNAINLPASGEFVSGWYFNFNPALNSDLSKLSFSIISNPTGFKNSNITVGTKNAADGGGYYNFEFDFPTSGPTFTSGEKVVVDVSGTNGFSVNESDFLYLAQPHGGNGVYYSAAHVQAESGGASGWVGATTVSAIPEPTSYAAIAGALALGLVVWRRRRLAAYSRSFVSIRG
jgi:hypothetical protein